MEGEGLLLCFVEFVQGYNFKWGVLFIDLLFQGITQGKVKYIR